MKLFGLYAALCTPAFALAMEDGQRLVKGLVYAQNISPFREQQTAEEKETLEGLRRRVDAIAVQKLEEVLEFAKSSNEFITAAASAAMEHVPETLTWVQWDTTPCFHAQDQQGRLYSINLLRGIVLLDGSPPRRIPSTILQHGLFQRCFGDAVFEVSMDRSGTFKTSRPVDGCFYEFQELSGGQLRISELKDGSSGKSRILLAMFASNYLTFDKMSLSYSIIFYHCHHCSVAWMFFLCHFVVTSGRSLHLVPAECLEREFPKRLVELHSHWRDEESNVILFRPVFFRERSTHFLYVPQQDGTCGVCRQIPDHLRAEGLDELLTHEDIVHQLVCEEAEVVDILHKFEDRAFIHQYINCAAHSHDENEIEQLELPRVNMAFTWQGGKWMSRDYRGYCLADNQKMRDTLIDFDSYLVLKKVDPNARCSVTVNHKDHVSTRVLR